MQTHIRLDNGRWLVGPGATQTSDVPAVPFQSIEAAFAAINRFHLSRAVFLGLTDRIGYTLFHYVPQS